MSFYCCIYRTRKLNSHQWLTSTPLIGSTLPNLVSSQLVSSRFVNSLLLYLDARTRANIIRPQAVRTCPLPHIVLYVLHIL